MSKVTWPIAIIISSIIAGMTIVIATESLKSPQSNYATVTYEDGYQRIGIIKKQEFSNEVIEQFNNRESQFDSIKEFIADTVTLDSNPKKAIFKPGTTIKATSSVKLLGTDGDLNLVIDTIALHSTTTKPLAVQDVIDELNIFENTSRLKSENFIKNSVKFERSPYIKTYSASKLL